MTVDVTARDRINRFAAVECAQCGRVWHRVRDDTPVTRGGYQSTLITLIAPSGQRRVIWQSHGATKATGDDSIVIVNAMLGQLDEAARAWREAADKRAAGIAKRKAAKAAADAAATRELMGRLAAMDEARAARAAEREAEDRAAEARERMGLA